MPIAFEELAEAKRRVKFRFLKHDVNVVYRLGETTSEQEIAFDEAMTAAKGDSEQVIVVLSERLERVIDEWDVLGRDGQPMPITVETLRRMPGAFLLAINDAIKDDNNPKALTR